MDTTNGVPARQRKPRPKPRRVIRVEVPLAYNGLGIVRITVGTERADYFLTPIPADFGRGFRVEKIGLQVNDPPYHVNIDGDKRTCDCTGFARWSHCKHADGIAALIAAGRL